MANASGGKMYIGKDDDGNTVDLGVKEARRLLESIPNSIVQALNYSNVSVDAKRDDNGLYIEIIVHKSDTPVFYQGSMYKRIGTANFKVEGNQQQQTQKDSPDGCYRLRTEEESEEQLRQPLQLQECILIGQCLRYWRSAARGVQPQYTHSCFCICFFVLLCCFK